MTDIEKVCRGKERETGQERMFSIAFLTKAMQVLEAMLTVSY